MSLHLKSVLLVLLVGLLTACGQGTVDSERDPVYFSPLEDQSIEPKVHDDPGPAMSAKERQQIQPVIEGFRRNARQVLAKPDIGERISQIESIFIASGHIVELANIYQDIVEEEGVSSPAAPRLAWILLQMGQEKQARMWIDRLLVEYPGRASSWYLDVIFHLPQLREGGSAAPRIVYGWNRANSDQTTELVGFGERQIAMVDQQVSQLEERLPEQALAGVEEELAELLATPVSELERPPALADEEPAAPTGEPDAVDQERAQAPVRQPDEDEQVDPDIAATTEEPKTPAEEQEPLKITVARGSIALSNDETEKAMRIFQSALERDPDNVAANLGMARASWTVEEMRGQSTKLIRELASRDDLTPRQKYEVGLFAFSKMDDNELATKMWTQVQSEDPELAEQVGLKDMLRKAK
jgi:tetratricopeptide (TPR) repeat protein